MAAAKKRGLGRGLDALLGNFDNDDAGSAETGGELRQIAVSKITPGKYQPRQIMDPERLEELAASIRAQGVIEPIVVRASGADRYELIAGERRWRATQLAGLSEIPAIVRDVDDRAAVAIALIENIQREELTPLEEAQSLKRLIDEFDLTHQEVADAVGRSRAAVSNLLRLMELPAEIKTLLEQRKLDMGHARALLTLSESMALGLARQAVEHAWSVRQLEEAVRAAQAGPKTLTKLPEVKRDPNVELLERELSDRIGARVAIRHGRGGRGQLVIRYHSLDELDGILGRIK